MSRRRAHREAAEQAAAGALAAAGLERADAALLFATPSWGGDLPELLEVAGRVLGTAAVAGASAGGVLWGGQEFQGPALGVLALDDVEAHAFLLRDVRGSEDTAGDEILARLGGPALPEDLVVLFPDPQALAPGPLLRGVRRALPAACVVGASGLDAPEEPSRQWAGSAHACAALAGIVLRGRRVPRVGVTQACRPVTPELRVTRSEGHWVLELDGRPALDVFREVARDPLAADLQRALGVIFAALPCGGSDGDPARVHRLCNVVGVSEPRRAFAVAEALRPGRRMALALRTADEARADLKRMLGELAHPLPAAALYLGCGTRGASLFGVEDLEAAYLQNALGDTPLLGMSGAWQLATLGGELELLTQAGVLALLDA